MTKEQDLERLALVIMLIVAFRLGRWRGRKSERKDLLRTIRALRNNTLKEQ